MDETDNIYLQFIKSIPQLEPDQAHSAISLLARHIKNVQRMQCIAAKSNYEIGGKVSFYDARKKSGNIWRTGVIVKKAKISARVDVQGVIVSIPYNRLSPMME